jgi:hypothetical protein
VDFQSFVRHAALWDHRARPHGNPLAPKVRMNPFWTLIDKPGFSDSVSLVASGI